MNCPKCKSKSITTEVTMSRGIGNEAKSLCTPAYRCLMCGYWKPAEAAPAMQLTPEQKKNKLPNARLKDHTLETLRPYMPSIRKLRSGKQPATWRSIANIIRQATGSKVKPETVKRHYEANQLDAA